MVYPVIERYLRESGKTVEALAQDVGTSRSTMYYKLNGHSGIDMAMARAIKQALGATESVEDLFKRCDADQEARG